MLTQHIATLLGATCCVRLATMLRCVATCWVLLAQVWKWSNLGQQHATRRNRVAKRTQHVAPNNVAICWVGMLRSFGRGLRYMRSTHGKFREEISIKLYGYSCLLNEQPIDLLSNKTFPLNMKDVRRSPPRSESLPIWDHFLLDRHPFRGAAFLCKHQTPFLSCPQV